MRSGGTETAAGQTLPTWRAPRHRAALWRIALGLLLILTIYFGVNMAGLFVYGLAAGPPDPGGAVEPAAIADSPASTLLLFATFLPLLLAVPLAVRWVHRERPETLIGPTRRTARHFLSAAGLVAAIYALALALWSLGADSQPNMRLGLWLALLPATLLAVGVQTLAEELVFRGYLQRYLAGRFRWRLIWLVLPSALFGALHFDPLTMGDSAFHAVAAAALFGLVAGDLTARTGSLGAAWGLHFANNIVAVAILATDGTITGLALRVTPYDVEEIGLSPLLMAADLLPLVLVWAVLRWRLRP